MEPVRRVGRPTVSTGFGTGSWQPVSGIDDENQESSKYQGNIKIIALNM
jgi:hypothetical protein